MQLQVLAFWFGVPGLARPPQMERVRRWFMGGEPLDAEIRQRFLPTVEAALKGELDGWAQTPEGRLALVLCLDQFPRNAFRGTPRAWAGDPAALAHAVAAFDAGQDAALDDDGRVFLALPFLHAEQVPMVERYARLVRGWLEAAPDAARPGLQAGLEQAEKYREVLLQFGRYPFRNAALGRPSTPA
jgi:uncharacterized protein (DUF924 family)